MEVRTILTVLMTLIVLGILGVVGYEIYNLVSPSSGTSSTSPVQKSVSLTSSLTPATTPQTVSTTLPPSLNEEDGIEFSFATWFVVNEFASTPGKSYLFAKGDLLTQAASDGTLTATASPAVYIDNTTNTLHVVQDTYSGQTDIAIPNIPANVLIHLAVTVTQATISVYINGIIKEYQMTDIPKQNTGTVNIAPGAGFKGLIGPMTYYNYALLNTDIVNLSTQPPSMPPTSSPAPPPYFDAQWYVNT
jgi:hypothetical protein